MLIRKIVIWGAIFLISAYLVLDAKFSTDSEYAGYHEGKTPPGLSITVGGCGKQYGKGREYAIVCGISLKRSTRRILDKMGPDYFRGVRAKHDISGQFTEWSTSPEEFIPLSEGHDAALSILAWTTRVCKKESNKKRGICIALQAKGTLYSFSSENVAILNTKEPRLYLVFAARER